MRDCCAFLFTETRLHSTIPDSTISLEGLTAFRVDRSRDLTGKSRGGGVCVYTNNNRCRNVEIIHSHCLGDVEFLMLKCHPFYLRREFTAVSIKAAYIIPSANLKEVLSILYLAQCKMQIQTVFT